MKRLIRDFYILKQLKFYRTLFKEFIGGMLIGLIGSLIIYLFHNNSEQHEFLISPLFLIPIIIFAVLAPLIYMIIAYFKYDRKAIQEMIEKEEKLLHYASLLIRFNRGRD